MCFDDVLDEFNKTNDSIKPYPLYYAETFEPILAKSTYSTYESDCLRGRLLASWTCLGEAIALRN